MASLVPKLKVELFSLTGDRLLLNWKWECWLERFERDLQYNCVNPEDRDNSGTCQMALLIYGGQPQMDLNDSLADVNKPPGVSAVDWTDYAKSKEKLNQRLLPKKSNDFALCELMTLKPANQESMVHFAGRLRKV